ncbi:MAG: winged helix-turn-helix transcriptional regulator [Bacteroidales bacterium]
MSKVKIQDEFDPNCPIRNILCRVSDKWSLLVLHTLSKHKVVRFKELQRSIPDISQKMLTVTLRSLEEDGFVTRKVYMEIPPKVEYRLTDRAESFLVRAYSLIEWAIDNMDDIIKDRKKNNKAAKQ